MQTLVQHPTTDGATAAVPADGPRVGDFVLGARLARRTLSDVYAATHVPSATPHLVYVLRADVMDDKPLVHRVVTEADTARWMRHGSAAKLEGHGQTPEGRTYVAVVRPVGRALAELFARGRVSPRGVVRLANPLVEALAEAHALGLVHGRITPGAVVVTSAADSAGGPRVLLSGLGMSVIGHEPEFAPAERPYVSPEQLAGRDADARSDVYGLASLVHHALVGAAPAPGGTPEGGSVAHGARSTDPAGRHPTVKAFWEDLLSALVSTAAAVEAPAAARPAAPAVAAAPAPRGGAPTARESRRVPVDEAAPARPAVGDLAPAPAPVAAHGRNPLVYAAMGGLPVALVLGFLLWPRGETVAAAGDAAAVPAAVIDAAAGGTTTVQSTAATERSVAERAAAPATSVRAARRAADDDDEAPEPRRSTRAAADEAEPRAAASGVKLPDVRLPVVEAVDTRSSAGGRAGVDDLSQRATVRASEFVNGARLRAGNQ
jgi:serine/threonine-protein kinase